MKSINFKAIIYILAFFSFLKTRPNLYSIETSQNYERFWVQYAEENSILFRSLIPLNKKCPSIKFDDSNFETKERKHSYKSEFPIRICQIDFKNDGKDHEIKFENHKIKIHSNLEKISTIGDTGCVIKKNKLTGKNFEQNCLDPKKHPLLLNSLQIKKEKPDLIIHVGDYYYSEAECQDLEKCGGRPYGDNFQTWRADFLDAAKHLFETAPLIMIRGNHEKCDRGGKGWAVMFDNSLSFKECTEYDAAFKIKFKNINFFMIDSSHSADLIKIESKKDQEKVEFYSSEFQKIFSNITSDKLNVILTHRPIFAWEFESWKKEAKNPNEINLILNDALLSVSPKKLEKIDFILSGHVHMGAILKIVNHVKHINLTQVISGNGGSNLNTARHYRGQKSIFTKDNQVKSYEQFNDFGFLNIFINSKKDYKFDFMNLK